MLEKTIGTNLPYCDSLLSLQILSYFVLLILVDSDECVKEAKRLMLVAKKKHDASFHAGKPRAAAVKFNEALASKRKGQGTAKCSEKAVSSKKKVSSLSFYF